VVGCVLQDLGDTGEALLHQRRTFDITQGLVARDATNADWQRELALARLRLTEVTRLRGTASQAESNYQESLKTLTSILEKSPKDVRRRRDVAGARLRFARLLLDSGKPETAALEAEQCLSVLSSLLSGSDPDALRIAVDCRLVYGDALAARRRPADARAQWCEALAAIEPAARTSEDPAVLQLWARALRAVGRLNEANEVAARLVGRGYRHPSFLEVFNNGVRPR
jgi:tetratricopeptide (TPR) repeat protein